MDTRQMWEIHPDLTRPRLYEVAHAILRGRRHALRHFRPSLGDTGWGHGCLAHERAKFQVVQLAEHADWLTILQERPRFIFGIGTVPWRFYRADVNDPPYRAMQLPASEENGLQLALELMPEPLMDRVFRIFIELTDQQDVSAIVFLQLDRDGRVYSPYRIPAAEIETLSIAGTQDDEGIVLPPPEVGDRADDAGLEDNKGAADA